MERSKIDSETLDANSKAPHDDLLRWPPPGLERLQGDLWIIIQTKYPRGPDPGLPTASCSISGAVVLELGASGNRLAGHLDHHRRGDVLRARVHAHADRVVTSGEKSRRAWL